MSVSSSDPEPSGRRSGPTRPPREPPLEKRRVTITDIARLAGVSHGTVSKALNGSDEVSAETRVRVEAIAKRLAYRPNAIARSLKHGRTRTIGIVTNDADGTLSTAMARGVAEVASERDFGVFVCNSFGRMAKERQHLELLLDKQVDGIILVGYKVVERGAPAAPTGATPLVYLYEYTTAVEAACILPDDRGGAGMATGHLLAIGRQRLGYINGPPTFEATEARLRGHRDALDAAGVPFDVSLLRTSPDWNQDSGFRLAQELMRQPDAPDGIVCANDELAAGAILGLRELGRSVPGDVSIIGFDDRPFAAHLPISLTTVALPLHEMGVSAAQKLFAALEGSAHPNEIERIPCRLVIRASCGAADGADGSVRSTPSTITP